MCGAYRTWHGINSRTLEALANVSRSDVTGQRLERAKYWAGSGTEIQVRGPAPYFVQHTNSRLEK